MQEGTLDGDADDYLDQKEDDRYIYTNGIRYTRPNYIGKSFADENEEEGENQEDYFVTRHNNRFSVGSE